MSSHASLAYRPEIDGLRALAVLPVLFYHAGFGFLGGFVGVDVFFVISGYLIGSVIIHETETGTFRFSSFWTRRVRRLFPALATVVATTAVAGFFWLVPMHLKLLGESIAGQFLLVANIQFWARSGYFEPASEAFPLLHTWSLAVEEQFYLFLPLILVPLLRRAGRRAAAVVVAAFLSTSLVWCLYITAVDPNTAFYLLPSRIWELDIGLLLALWKKKGFGNRRIDTVAGVLGLAGIMAAYFLYDNSTPFPGAAAALPCLGAALFLFANSGGLTISGKWLARPFPIWIGKISYPLYLWHWPCLVLLKYIWIVPLPAYLAAAALLLSCLLAWGTWKWIETPVRQRRVLAPTRRLVAASGAVATVLLGTGILFYEKHASLAMAEKGDLAASRSRVGMEGVYELQSWEQHGGPPMLGARDPDAPKILVWGDSHAMAAMPVLDDLGRDLGVTVYVATRGGMPPVVGVRGGAHVSEADRSKQEQQVLQLVDSIDFDVALFISCWPIYLGSEKGDPGYLLKEPGARKDSTMEEAALLFLKHFPETIELFERRGSKVYILQNVGSQPFDVPRAILRARKRGLNANDWALSLEEHRAKSARAVSLLGRAVEGSHSVLLDPMPFFTDENGIYLVEKNGESLYADWNHLSPFGSRQLRPLLEPMFQEARRRSLAE